jgi:hypothetical protein
MAFRLRIGGAASLRNLQKKVNQLIAEGKHREAIELLSAYNSANPSPQIENQLTQLRHDAFFELDHPKPALAWPPSPADIFDTSSDIPEILASEIDVVKAHAGVFKHGSLIIRGLLSSKQISVLADCVENAFQAFDDTDSRGDHQSWFTELQSHQGLRSIEFDRPWVRSGGGVLAAESPRALFHLIEIFQEIGMIDLITEYLGERPALSVKKTTLRRTESNLDATNGWHQDGAFLGEGIRTLNVWVALTDCGIDSPSMDMIPRRLDGLVPTGTEGAMFNWSVSPLAIEDVCKGGQPQHLVFKAGDAIIFDEVNLHRTSTLPDMTKTRLAIESWFFAPSCYPIDQLPILI